MEKGAEDDEALNVTEIFYNRVADHIRNQPDAARSHPFDKERMDELIQALDGWDDLDMGGAEAQGRWAWSTETKSMVEEGVACRELLFRSCEDGERISSLRREQCR